MKLALGNESAHAPEATEAEAPPEDTPKEARTLARSDHPATEAEAPPEDTPGAPVAARGEGPRHAGAGSARRWTVGLVAALHAAVLGGAAIELPWRSFTAFTAVTAGVAALHLATAMLSLIPHPVAARVWRAASIGSLGYLAYLTFNLVSSAVYITSLNRGLGSGIAAALGAVWAVAALFTLPFACWGVAATGGVPRRRGARPALATLLALSALGVVWEHQAAKADVAPVPGGSPERTVAALRDALPELASLPAPAERTPPSLFTIAPAACAVTPGAGGTTIVVTHLTRVRARAAATTRCVQSGPGEDAVVASAALRAELAAGLRGPVKIDVISASQPLRSPGPGLDGLSLRPGLDGLCREEGARARCLMPWQLIALDAFNANAPFPGIPDFRFGFSVTGLRKALGEDRPEASLRGLRRVETLSYVADAEGELHLLSRLGQPARALDAASLAEATRAAQGYIVAAQRGDGMFRYLVDPFSGRASFEGFSVARQAGTTLALCELGEQDAADPRPTLRSTIQRSLAMLAKLERVAGEGGAAGAPIGAIVYPQGSRDPVASLNPTALSLIAFLSCRPIVGPEHDALIGRLARMVLATQREDGGFAPRFNLALRAPVPGPGQLYESGQAIMALVLLEALSTAAPAPELPQAGEVRAAVERAMEYFATRYWDHFAADFLYMEENWHCLAARAALGHHRHDGYERFCIDYVTFKSRLVLDEGSGVHPDFLGGYGFGNVLAPHNTSTAGYGEALAAAMALKEARGEDLTADRARMEKVLGFLVRQPWDAVSCFACARGISVEGAFSESMTSPQIRIDYVQHAWAALGHGGRMLGLLPRRDALGLSGAWGGAGVSGGALDVGDVSGAR